MRSPGSQSFHVEMSCVIDTGYLREVELEGQELMLERVATRALETFEIGG